MKINRLFKGGKLMGLFSKKGHWMKLIDRQLIAEALELMENELRKARDPMERHGIQYAYANALYTYTGQGVRAREAFADLLNMQRQIYELRGNEFVMWTIHNNAQLARSYDDYFKYADMMKGLFPNAPLVTSQAPEIAAKKDAGIPWIEAQMNMALSYGQNTGFGRPTTMYSCMACLYSVILSDSKRIQGDDKTLEFLQDIASLYTEAIANLVKAYRMMGNASLMQPTVDYICRGASSLLSEFACCHPESKDIPECSYNIEQISKGKNIPPRYDTYAFSNQSGIIDQIDDKTRKALYLDAAGSYEKAEAEVTEPILRILLAHNRSIFYWTYIGKGSTALEMMEKEWQLWSTLHIPAEYIPAARVMAGETAENAMLVCPDFDSFVKWRERLLSVNPKAGILSEIGRTFEEDYENGRDWWNCMYQTAMSMYDRNDPAHDEKRYGNGAAIWQMMLENRKKLVLTREVWKTAATEYGILTLRLVAQNARQLGPSYTASQGALPVRIAMPYIEEYIAAHPGDEVETAILKDMKMVISEAGSL